MPFTYKEASIGDTAWTKATVTARGKTAGETSEDAAKSPNAIMNFTNVGVDAAFVIVVVLTAFRDKVIQTISCASLSNSTSTPDT